MLLVYPGPCRFDCLCTVIERTYNTYTTTMCMATYYLFTFQAPKVPEAEGYHETASPYKTTMIMMISCELSFAGRFMRSSLSANTVLRSRDIRSRDIRPHDPSLIVIFHPHTIPVKLASILLRNSDAILVAACLAIIYKEAVVSNYQLKHGPTLISMIGIS